MTVGSVTFGGCVCGGGKCPVCSPQPPLYPYHNINYIQVDYLSMIRALEIRVAALEAKLSRIETERVGGE